jgi:hypothetical protein
MASALASLPASAQAVPPQTSADTEISAPAAQGAGAAAGEPGGASRFLRDVGSDYKEFFSAETALWLRVGLGASAAVHAGDEAASDNERSDTLDGGQEYGALSVQVPLALAWWIAGHAAGSARAAAAGRDLVRAQISVASWTYALKIPIDRTRPNGDPRSFPSGHASSTFATATVLAEHYGWKLGLPAFAAAAYTACSRVTDNKHWASDVAFGAFLGIASAQTVTRRLRSMDVSVVPWGLPGGAGILVSALR